MLCFRSTAIACFAANPVTVGSTCAVPSPVMPTPTLEQLTKFNSRLARKGKMLTFTGIHQIAAGSFANLPRFRLAGNPAPLARAVDSDGTSRRHAER
jgi:hypothetical protein